MGSKRQKTISLEGVYTAAKSLLEARDAQMLTPDEWTELRTTILFHDAIVKDMKLQFPLVFNTKVKHRDGTIGRIVAGYSYNEQGVWNKYEVVTYDGPVQHEFWLVSDFTVCSGE